ncbi:hypothetical protein DJICPGNB_18770 [Escherichia coli]|nr:hypothetical protein DJICPGNB_18770 [Escherichia coli]
MNILHICVTSKWFNIDNKIVDHPYQFIRFCVAAITRAKPIEFKWSDFVFISVLPFASSCLILFNYFK